MRYLDYVKQFGTFDTILVLFDELGYTDEEITTKLEVTKGTLYNARKRQEALLEALKNMNGITSQDKRNPAVQAIVEAFTENFGTTKATQYDRWAAKRLATKHSEEVIVKVIKALALYTGDKYAPAVNNVRQLEEKWVSVGKFLNNKAGSQVVEL